VEIALKIIEQLPPIWPRLLFLAVLLLLLFVPQVRQFLSTRATGPRRLGRVRSLLEVRKLQLDVAKLRAAHPELTNTLLDGEIDRILAEPVEPDTKPALPWRERIALAGYGAIGFVILSTLAVALSGRREGVDLLTGVLREGALTLPCAALASAIPTHSRWGPVFYAFLIPFLVVALAVTARLQG